MHHAAYNSAAIVTKSMFVSAINRSMFDSEPRCVSTNMTNTKDGPVEANLTSG